MPPVSFPWESYIYRCSVLEKAVRKGERERRERREGGRERGELVIESE